jgi:hypothetical protein
MLLKFSEGSFLTASIKLKAAAQHTAADGYSLSTEHST